MKKKLARLIALVIALCLITLLYLLYASFYGSPIEKLLLQPKLVNYVKKNYPQLDLVCSQQVQYNFKEEAYFLTVSSDTSQDLAFTVYYYSNEKKIADDYDYRVKEGSNTWARLDSEYDAFIDPFFQKFSTQIELSYATLTKNEEISYYELDTTFNFYNPPVETSAIVWLTDQPSTIDNLAQHLTLLAQFFTDEKIRIDYYSLTLRNDQDHQHELSVFNFPRTKILNNPNLVQDLQQSIDDMNEADKEKK